MQRWLEPALARPSLLRRLPALLLAAALGLICVALMEPVVPFSEAEVESQGLDIAIVLDLSEHKNLRNHQTTNMTPPVRHILPPPFEPVADKYMVPLQTVYGL